VSNNKRVSKESKKKNAHNVHFYGSLSVKGGGMAKGEPVKITPTEAQLRTPGFDGAALRKLRREKEITQKELAERAGLDRAYVANIENGNVKFTEDAGEKLWTAVIDLASEKYISSGKAAADAATMPPMGTLGWGLEIMERMGIGPKAQEKTKDEIIALQQKQIETQAGIIANLKELKHWPEIEFLLKRMDEMEQRIKDLCQLNGLRTEAVVKTSQADELQEQIEQNLRKDSEG
jgi:transcriptional regulator with XRE-family HTH domain